MNFTFVTYLCRNSKLTNFQGSDSAVGPGYALEPPVGGAGLSAGQQQAQTTCYKLPVCLQV